MATDARPLLELDAVSAGYGQSSVLADITLSLAQGESLAVLGRNGMGKSTLIKTIMGLTRLRGGQLRFRGLDLNRTATHGRVRAGIGWVPQERLVFPSLTVEEHLTAVPGKGPWTPKRIYHLFPRLEERRRNFGNRLSGGEQQMLAIGRALATNPSLLLLDEPMEGLAPVIVEHLAASIRSLCSEGLAVVLVEQHAALTLSLTETAVILDRGRIVHRAKSQALSGEPATMQRWLAVG